MILKYKIPKDYRHRYDNKKTIYCLVKKQIVFKMSEKRVYLVEMINFRHLSNVFGSEELSKLNLFDRIKLLFY